MTLNFVLFLFLFCASQSQSTEIERYVLPNLSICGKTIPISPPTLTLESSNSTIKFYYECVVHFYAPTASDQIQINFTGHLATARGLYYDYNYGYRRQDNNFDYIDVYNFGRNGNDISNSAKITRFTATFANKVHFSKGQNITVKFKIDTGRNWRLLAKFNVIGSLGCEIVDTTSQKIESQHFPKSIFDKINCETVIQAPENQIIIFEFVEFELPYIEKCATGDYLELRDRVNTTHSTQLLRLCGSETPTQIISSSRFVDFRLHKSTTEEMKFLIQYRFVNKSNEIFEEVVANDTCQSFFGVNSLKSPNWPDSYRNNALCQRLIQAPFGNIIIFRIDSFDLEPSRNCMNDYLRIFDGVDLNSPVNEVFCGSVQKRTVVTAGNLAFVVFKSDVSLPAAGFNITFNFVKVNPNLTDISVIPIRSEQSFNKSDCQTDLCLLHVSKRKTFIDAYQTCHRLDTNLMTSETEERFVNWQTMFFRNKMYENDTYVWLGGMRKARYHYSFQWLTASSTTDFSFQNWAPKEPKNYFGFDCVKMSTVTGLWFAAHCNEQLMSFCVMDRTVTTEISIFEARHPDDNLWKALYESQQADLQQLAASLNELSETNMDSETKIESKLDNKIEIRFKNVSDIWLKQLKMRDLLISRMLDEIESLKTLNTGNETRSIRAFNTSESIFQNNSSKLEKWLTSNKNNEIDNKPPYEASHAVLYVTIIVMFFVGMLVSHLCNQRQMKQLRLQRARPYSQPILLNEVSTDI